MVCFPSKCEDCGMEFVVHMPHLKKVRKNSKKFCDDCIARHRREADKARYHLKKKAKKETVKQDWLVEKVKKQEVKREHRDAFMGLDHPDVTLGPISGRVGDEISSTY